jgi:3-dehydroquinate synthetase
VGLGLLAALRLSGRDDLRATVCELLKARGLPTSLAHAAPDDVLAALARDKKRMHDSVPFVLVREPGDVAVESHVAAKDIAVAVAELVR